MDVTKIPFNEFLGVKKSAKEGCFLEIDPPPNYLNHLETVHASVQFALAEAASGECLANRFKKHINDVIPLVRRAEVKYRKPAKGKLFAKANMTEEEAKEVINELESKGRTIINVNVDLFDSQNILTMNASFEWFVQKTKK